MSRLRITLAAGLLVMAGGWMAAPAQAQVVVMGRPVVGPRVVARAVLPAPVLPAPVVTTYRPVVTSYVAPTYGVYRPVLAPAPVYRSPVVVTTRVRPAVIGPGIGGLPNVYVPGQPIRNTLRFALP